MSTHYVIDANVILNFMQDGPGTATIDRLLRQSARGEAQLSISIVNVGEVFYSVWKLLGEKTARSVADELGRIGLEIAPVELSQVLKAGEMKLRYRIPYVDGLATALALEKKATLVTTDRDFEKLGRKFPILWATY